MLNWYALHTKPHSEKLVCNTLSARGVETYLPLWQPPRPSRRMRGPRPFFPCYLFVHADLETLGVSALQYLPGVRRLVFSGGEPARVPPAAIDRIRVRLSELEKSITDGLGEPLAAGDRVMITSGPLAGLEAVFDRGLSDEARVRLLVDFLQRGTAVEIDREAIRKVTLGRENAERRKLRGKQG